MESGTLVVEKAVFMPKFHFPNTEMNLVHAGLILGNGEEQMQIELLVFNPKFRFFPVQKPLFMLEKTFFFTLRTQNWSKNCLKMPKISKF